MLSPADLLMGVQLIRAVSDAMELASRGELSPDEYRARMHAAGRHIDQAKGMWDRAGEGAKDP